LYQPLYAPRPTVEPELFASLRPQTYDGDMYARARDAAPAAIPAPAEAAPPGMAGKLARRLADEKPADGTAGRYKIQNGGQSVEALTLDVDRLMDLRAGVASVATAQKLGESFQYRIEHAVNLPRQKSALLPIVQHD